MLEFTQNDGPPLNRFICISETLLVIRKVYRILISFLGDIQVFYLFIYFTTSDKPVYSDRSGTSWYLLGCPE